MVASSFSVGMAAVAIDDPNMSVNGVERGKITPTHNTRVIVENSSFI